MTTGTLRMTWTVFLFFVLIKSYCGAKITREAAGVSEKCVAAMKKVQRCDRPSPTSADKEEICSSAMCMVKASGGCTKKEQRKLKLNLRGMMNIQYQLGCDVELHGRNSELSRRGADACDLNAPIICEQDPDPQDNDVMCSQTRCLYLSLVACDPSELREINMSEERLGQIEKDYMKYCETI